jgi:PAS domain S-box-containing protein
MDRARVAVADMTSVAAARLAARQSRARSVRNSAAVAVCASGGLTVLLLFLFGTSTRRTMQMRTRAAEQIAEQKDLLQTTISSIGDGVVVTTVDGRVIVLNPVAQALSKWQETAAIGRRVDDVLTFRHKPTDRPLENPVTVALRERRKVALPAQTVMIARDGTETYVEDSCAPIVDSAGHVRGCVMVFRDITVRRRFDDELRASDRRKSEFIATLSHELRNPLAAVRSALDAVRNEPERVPAKDGLLSLMDRQVRHMVRMIDDLLDVARLSRGALQLRPAVIDVARVVQDAVETVQPMLERRAHPLAIDVPARELYVLADSARLAQVISNLLTNAVKYSPIGSQIAVSAALQGESVVISVRDSGIGLTPESLDAIFDIFVQVEPAANEMKEGLGIGLSLARQIITLHHGKIEARSAGIGQGSEFLIKLQRQTAETGVERGAPVEPSVARNEVQSVLIADDNEDAADALATVLRLSGFEVTVAYNGVEASRLANRLQPDAVLLDIGMPGMSGYEVARSIRDAAWAKRATLIAVTGWGQEDDRKQAAAAGFDMHFTKPVDFSVLQNAILTAGAQQEA